jgi:hypothetical protein
MKLRRRAARQHLHDQSIIEHLTKGPARPTRAPVDPRGAYRFDSEHGRRLLKAIKERWRNREGLAEF